MIENRTGAFLRSAWSMTLAAGFLTLAASALAQEPAPGQNPPPPTSEHEAAPAPKPEETDTRIRVQTNIVTAPVTVTNSKGDYISDLEEKDFEVLDNGVEQKIEQFSLEQRTLSAVIVVEANSTSESLLGEVHPLGPVFSSLLLGPQGQAAVVTYGEDIRDVQGFTQNGDELDSALRHIEARGGSRHLNDALANAIAMLETQPKDNRRIIVAFTDGHDIGSRTTREEVLQRALDADVTIYGLGFSPTHAMLAKQPKAPPPDPLATNMALPAPPGQASTPSNVQNQWPGSSQNTPDVAPIPIFLEAEERIHSLWNKDPIELYAGYTGGVSLGAWTKNSLQDELTKIANEIQSQYEIAYVPHAPSHNGFHRIEVHVDRSGVRVKTKAGYFLGGAGGAGSTP